MGRCKKIDELYQKYCQDIYEGSSNYTLCSSIVRSLYDCQIRYLSEKYLKK